MFHLFHLTESFFMAKPIAFYPDLAKELGGDIEAAIYYQQLDFWAGKGGRKDGFIYKSKKDIEDETTLTRDKQDRIRKKLEALGWIETKVMKANGAPTLHFRTKVSVTMVMHKHGDKSVSISGKDTNPLVRKPLNLDKRETLFSITESTREITTENSRRKRPLGINMGFVPIGEILA